MINIYTFFNILLLAQISDKDWAYLIEVINTSEFV